MALVPGLLSTILSPFKASTVKSTTAPISSLQGQRGQHSLPTTSVPSISTHPALTQQTITHFLPQVSFNGNEDPATASKTDHSTVAVVVFQSSQQHGTNTTLSLSFTDAILSTSMIITPGTSPTILPSALSSNGPNSSTAGSPVGHIHRNWVPVVATVLSIGSICLCLTLVHVQRRRRRKRRIPATDTSPFQRPETDLAHVAAPFDIFTNRPAASALNIVDIDTNTKRRVPASNAIVHFGSLSPQKTIFPLQGGHLPSVSTRARTRSTLSNVNNVEVLDTIVECEIMQDPSRTTDVVAGANGPQTRTLTEQVQALEERLRVMENIRVAPGMSLSDTERDNGGSSEPELRELVPPPRYTTTAT